MNYDSINPSHYHGDRKYEPIAVIEDWGLNYRLGNAIKYLSRNGRKPGENPIEGLKKAIWYIEREIEALEKAPTYGVTYKDVLEDYAACAADSKFYNHEKSLDNTYIVDMDYDLWDESLGPSEPLDYMPKELKGEYCDFDVRELHKDLDQFEKDEIVSTFERRGLIFGVDKLGKTWILGVSEITE